MASYQDSDDDHSRTIYHEAGHCVMAVVSGARVDRATVAPEEDGFHGIVEIQWYSKSKRTDHIAVALAGPVAEMIYLGEPYHPGFVPEWAHDWKQAWTIARTSTRSDRDCLQLLEQIVAKLYRVFRQDRWWAAVAAVSDLLDAHEEIDHDEIAYEVENWIHE
ncbi:hypothetical protein SH449x_001133 [Pirellulaceae bacterium SH449]